MKIRIDNTAEYKKIISTICSITNVRKQLNSIEQCIQLESNRSQNGSPNLCITSVDVNSHAVSLLFPVEIVEEGKQIVLSTKLKAMTNKLNNKYGLLLSDENSQLNYEMKPYGTITDQQYFNQSSTMSDDMFEESKYKEIANDLSFFISLIPMACSNSYNEKEIYVDVTSSKIKLYTQFTETSYVRYTCPTSTLSTASLTFSIRPNLLKTILILGEGISLHYSKELHSIMFVSLLGRMVFKIDDTTNKIATRVDLLIDQKEDSSLELLYEDLIESLNWQSYNASETNSFNFKLVNEPIKTVIYNNVEEEDTIEEEVIEESLLHINLNTVIDKDQYAELSPISYSGVMPEINISVGHILKALTALGSPKNKIIPTTEVKLNVKAINVKNGPSINCIHLNNSKTDEIDSNIIMYETVSFN